MSQYASIDDLTNIAEGDLLASLADDSDGTPDITDPDTVAVINRALQNSSARIDAALRGQGISLPLQPPIDPFLIVLACELALPELWGRRTGQPTYPRETSLLQAEANLKRICTGEMKVEISGAAEVTPTISSTTDADDATFTKETLKAF